MQHLFSIDRTKAEAPIIATFFIIGLAGSIAFYPVYRWYAFLLFPLLAVIFLGLKKIKLGFFKRQCFIYLDDAGIKYCLHVYQRPVFIAWEQIEKITYQLYEINIRLKKSGLLISLQIGYLKNPEEFEDLKVILNGQMGGK